MHPLFYTIPESTIWCEPNYPTRIVWATLLHLADDEDGSVHLTLPELANLAGVTAAEASQPFPACWLPTQTTTTHPPTVARTSKMFQAAGAFYLWLIATYLLPRGYSNGLHKTRHPHSHVSTLWADTDARGVFIAALLMAGRGSSRSPKSS